MSAAKEGPIFRLEKRFTKAPITTNTSGADCQLAEHVGDAFRICVYRLAMAFSLTLILGLIVFGGGRSEAYYRAGAAGWGPRGCAAVGVAGTGRYGYGYRAGGVVVHRY
jgi:hypothetical protein